MWLCQCGDAACCVLWARILSFTSWTGQKPVNETGLQRNLRAMLVLQTIQNNTPQQMELFSHARISLILHHSVPSGRRVGFGKERERYRERGWFTMIEYEQIILCQLFNHSLLIKATVFSFL